MSTSQAQEAEKLKSSESPAFLAISSPAGDLQEEEQTVRKPQDLKNRCVCVNWCNNSFWGSCPNKLIMFSGLWSTSHTFPMVFMKKLCAPSSVSLGLWPIWDLEGDNHKLFLIWFPRYDRIFRATNNTWSLLRSKKTGRSCGFAFVEFKYREVAEVSLQTFHLS